MKFKNGIIALILLLIFLDQLSKFCVTENLKDSSADVFLGLKVTYVENTGGAFGFAQNSMLGLIAANFVVLRIIIHFLIVQKDKIDFKTTLSLSFILAGGFSNLIDRFTRGFVVDFIDITDILKFPMFNMADMYVVIGCILIVVFFLFANPIAKKIKEVKKERILQIDEKSNS